MVRILQVGLGPLGLRVLEDFRDRGLGEVVAAIDSAPELVGKPLVELVPGIPTPPGEQVRVAGSIEELGSLEVVNAAIVTTSSSLEACFETFVALLGRKLHVISSCEELAWPWLRHPVLAAELHERCVKARRTVVGTGINPGFLMDTLPVVISGAAKSVRAVESWRIQDATTRRVPFQRKIGASLDLAAFEQARVAGTLRHVGLGESLHFVAHYLGLGLERWEESLEPVIAERELTCALGTIPAGHAAGVRQVATGWRDGERVVTLTFQAAIGQADPHDRVLLDSEPPIDLVIRGGVHGDVATSAILLNTIGSVREVEPGLRTMADLRPPRCEPSDGRRPAAREEH